GPTLILGQDGSTLRSLESDEGLLVDFVALSSDGRQLATVSPRSGASYSGLVDIWDVDTGTLSHSVELPDEFEPWSALFADDDAVWIGGRDGNSLPTVLEIEATTGAVLGELQHSSRPGNAVTALAISDDGRTLATGAMDRRISLWDTGTLAARPGGEFTGHRGNVTGIVFWDGGDTLISSDDAGDIVMWDVSDRRQFARLGGPTDDVTSLDLDADSATLLASSEDGYLWTWSLDPELWRHLACQLAGRNMTQAEWEVYGDGGTRVRHCVDFPAEDGDVRDADYSGSLTD
ncbi:MAG TPA: hypothetical protein VFV63_08905, partial [Ilumatobacteraceae bacterium]|nr:hypothetical protein [Ilumatobacteraceae bacterium]